jgi:hypothetical protein
MGKRMETVEVAIAANTRNRNVLEGTRFQKVGATPVLITLFDTGSAAGLNREFGVDAATAVALGPVNANNRIPLDPDDKVAEQIEAYPGSNLFMPVENTTAGALTFRARLIFEDAMEM